MERSSFSRKHRTANRDAEHLAIESGSGGGDTPRANRPREGQGRPEERGDVAVATKVKPKSAKPKLYKVLFHNDDFTTREFVVSVLQMVFHHSETEATRIMMLVHTNGVGVAGIFPFEIAETKAEKSMMLARRFEYPLRCTVEQE